MTGEAMNKTTIPGHTLLDTLERTSRGFQLVEFADANSKKCSLQQSSVIDDTERGYEQPGTSFVWLGIDGERMHLHRYHVRELISLLRQWHETGNFG
jgi:hypothetical protein